MQLHPKVSKPATQAYVVLATLDTSYQDGKQRYRTDTIRLQLHIVRLGYGRTASATGMAEAQYWQSRRQTR